MPSSRILVLALLPACWTAPTVARACEPSWPDTVTFPPAGSQLPRNAAVRITGDAAAHMLLAKVDGLGATLVELVELGGPEQPTGELLLPVVVFRVDPKPQIGAKIELLPAFEPVLAYTAGPADTTPPAPLADVSVDLHDYVIPGCPNDCNGGFVLNYWLTLDGGAQDDGSPVVHNIFLDDTGSGTDGKLIYTIMAGSQQRVLLPRRPEWATEHDPLHDVCFTVRTFDTAMNEAPVAHRVCKLCRARIEPGDPGEQCQADVTDEPAWGPGDVVRDGACSATQIPPLPAPPPEPDTTTGDDSTGDPSTGDDSTGDDSTTTSTTTTTTTTDPSPPEPTGTTALPTTGDPPSDTTAAPPPGGSTGSSAGGDDGLVDHGCACNETSDDAPQSLLLLLGVALGLRRPRR